MTNKNEKKRTNKKIERTIHIKYTNQKKIKRKIIIQQQIEKKKEKK